MRAHRVVPYSWAVQTPLSNFETRLDNSYRERDDPALTVAFTLQRVKGETTPLKLLAWTTTPWTLPSNLALAVNPALDYAILREGRRAPRPRRRCRSQRYERELKVFAQKGTLKGSDLVGRRYEPMFPFFKDTPNAFRVLAADFANAEDGTGIVHIAPGFGEEDIELARADDIPLVVPVDVAGPLHRRGPRLSGAQRHP